MKRLLVILMAITALVACSGPSDKDNMDKEHLYPELASAKIDRDTPPEDFQMADDIKMDTLRFLGSDGVVDFFVAEGVEDNVCLINFAKSDPKRLGGSCASMGQVNLEGLAVGNSSAPPIAKDAKVGYLVPAGIDVKPLLASLNDYLVAVQEQPERTDLDQHSTFLLVEPDAPEELFDVQLKTQSGKEFYVAYR